MKTILIIDDDIVTLNVLLLVLKPYEHEFKVLTAKNGQLAIDIITSKPVDLIITDLQMPVMDGFQVLAFLNQRYPEIPVFVMTAFGTDEIKDRVMQFGVQRYFEKPLNGDLLTEAIYDEFESGAKGQIEGIDLASFVQLVEMERKTCTLTIKAGNKKGRMYFQKGELIAADFADMKSEKAAHEILSWERTSIQIENVCRKKTREIKHPLMNILMEGLRLKDERQSTGKTKTPLSMPSVGKSKKPEPAVRPEKAAPPPPPSPKKPTIDRLAEAFSKASGIYEFGIYGENDEIKNVQSVTEILPTLKPSSYFSLSDNIKSSLGNGHLRFIVIKQETDMHYVMFKYMGHHIIAALKPDIRPTDFMKKIKPAGN